jgi:pimeloyl-ACP methyl ester carboxylesterase
VPTLERPDGAKIHWEQRGEGAALYLAHNPMISTPSTFDALIDDLARDHRVVTWDPRGVGRSSRDGPYELDTDADDLAALVEAVARPGVVMAIGLNPTPLVLVDRHPELVAAVVLAGGLPQLEPTDTTEAQWLLQSDSVTTAILQMARTDPRALVRAMITLGNPQLNEVELRERVEVQLSYCPVEAGLARVGPYLGHDVRRTCEVLAERLWIVSWESPMAPGRPLDQVRAALPRAHVVEADDGPLSRPDLTAGVVREAGVSAG